jgi:hypothetical protein
VFNRYAESALRNVEGSKVQRESDSFQTFRSFQRLRRFKVPGQGFCQVFEGDFYISSIKLTMDPFRVLPCNIKRQFTGTWEAVP